MRYGLRCLLVAAAGVVASGNVTSTHETATHLSLGGAALTCLTTPGCLPGVTSARPILPNLLDLSGGLPYGAIHEDDYFFTPTPLLGLSLGRGRFLFHFYDPWRSPAALNNSLAFVLPPASVNVSATCSSIDWGLALSSPFARSCTETFDGLAPLPFNISTTQVNQRSWSQALEADSNGAPTAESITTLGYIVHLLEDLGSPPHTRNDGHPCILGQYCSLFEKLNDYNLGGGRGVPTLPSGPQIITTGTFTRPEEFFEAMASYTHDNYYSENTAFADNDLQVAEDDGYFYGHCIAATDRYVPTQCQTVNGVPRLRRIASKGPLYIASCGASLDLDSANCDRSLATIDSRIAIEQFNELSPVIAQHVAAFIAFYAPSVVVSTDGTPGASVSSGPGGISGCTSGPCAALFVNGTNVQLTAQVPAGYSVTWVGGCSGTGPTVMISNLTADTECEAMFSPSSSGQSVQILTLSCVGTSDRTIAIHATGIVDGPVGAGIDISDLPTPSLAENATYFGYATGSVGAYTNPLDFWTPGVVRGFSFGRAAESQTSPANWILDDAWYFPFSVPPYSIRLEAQLTLPGGAVVVRTLSTTCS